MKDALELFKFHVDGKFFLVCVLLSVDGKCSQGAFARYVENLAKVHAYTNGFLVNSFKLPEIGFELVCLS